MNIEELEQHIKELGSLMSTALMQYELSGCFADLGIADKYKWSMEQAIAERVARQAK